MGAPGDRRSRSRRQRQPAAAGTAGGRESEPADIDVNSRVVETVRLLERTSASTSGWKPSLAPTYGETHVLIRENSIAHYSTSPSMPPMP